MRTAIILTAILWGLIALFLVAAPLATPAYSAERHEVLVGDRVAYGIICRSPTPLVALGDMWKQYKTDKLTSVAPREELTGLLMAMRAMCQIEEGKFGVIADIVQADLDWEDDPVWIVRLENGGYVVAWLTNSLQGDSI